MIRPLIVSLYDYRMAFLQETNEQLRNGYKMHYMEASAYLAADEIFAQIDQQGLDPEEAIKQWNQKPQGGEGKEREWREGREGMEGGGGGRGTAGKVDYKSRLDELFKANNRTYYRNR